MSHGKDLSEKARRSIRREFRRFKRRLIYHGSREEIWEACGKIHFFFCLKEYFEWNEGIPVEYLELAAAEPALMERAWRQYLRDESLNYRTWKEIDRLLEAVLMHWRLPLAG